MAEQRGAGGRADFNVDDFIPNAETLRHDYNSADFSKAWADVEDQLNKNLVIAFLGTAASGKTSAIKALFEVDLGNIHPIPGSTRKVIVFAISDNVFIVDAPGFGDIHQEIAQKAKDICEGVDVFVYLLNAEGGYKQQEKEDYQRLVALNRDVLVVVNKIDLLRAHQKEEFLEDQRNKMGVPISNFIAVAFDPLPQISESPIDVDKVREWLQKTLDAKGKDLLFAKYCRDKDNICEKYIIGASVAAAGIGAIPVPFSDVVLLTPVQAALIAKIALIYDHNLSKDDAAAFIVQILSSGAGRQAFRFILSALKVTGIIPVLGWLTTAAVSTLAAGFAASLTYGLGKAAKAYYKSGMKIPMDDLQDIFKTAFDLYQAKEVKKV